MRAFRFALCCVLLAGCAAGGAGGNAVTVAQTPDGKALIETQVGADGSKVVEFTIRSGATGALPAGLLPPEAAAEYASVARQVKSGELGYYRYVAPPGTAAVASQPLAAAPKAVAAAPQPVAYSGGNPPAKVTDSPAPAPKKVAEPVATTTSLSSYGGVPDCGLKMVGGAGYACVDG